MTAEDALKAMACIEAQFDGTGKSAETIAKLVIELIERPETFWEAYFEILTPNDSIRRKAQELFLSGAVTPDTTFGEAWEILKRERDGK